MENLNSEQKNERRKREQARSALRRMRIPMLAILGVLTAAFIVIPLAFDLLDVKPTVIQVSAVMANAPMETPRPESALNVENVEASEGDTASKYALLKLGDTSPAVIDIQERLTELQYIDGDEPTEYFGEAIEAAVKRFQRVHHMTETGAADELTQELLFSNDAAEYRLEEGDRGEDVESLQERLYDLGYEVEKQNGYFGVATARALTSFQTRNKLDANGVMDSGTSDILYSNNARPKVDPTPTPTPRPKTTPTPKATKRPSVTADGGAATTKTASPNTGGGGTVAVATGDVSGFIATAKAQLDKPYILGDEGPNSFDCSGLVYYSLVNNGVKVGRLSAKSFAVIDSWPTVGSTGELQTGDLLFFRSDSSSTISHTGIWLGGSKYIHASASAGKVVISSWSNWAERNFSHGKRVF